MRNTPCSRMPLWRWILIFVLGIILFFFLYGLAQISGDISPKTLPSSLAYIFAAAVVLFVYKVYFKKFEKRIIHELRLSAAAKDLGKGFLVGIGYFILVVGTMAIFGCYKIVSFQFPWQGLLKAFCMFLMVGVGEEILFRGVIYRMIDQRWNTAAALIISSLIFGLIHISNPNATLFSSVAIALEAGLLLGAAFSYSETLWFPIGIHWAWNFTQGNILGFAVSGNDYGVSLFTPEISGPDIITGGEFGAEASVLAIFYGVLISAYFIWKIIQNRKSEKVYSEEDILTPKAENKD